MLPSIVLYCQAYQRPRVAMAMMTSINGSAIVRIIFHRLRCRLFFPPRVFSSTLLIGHLGGGIPWGKAPWFF